MELQKGFSSLINWLHKTGEHDEIIKDIIQYDNQKSQRLSKLKEIVNLPINITHVIDLGDIYHESEIVEKIKKERGGDFKLAFRIAPKEEYAGSIDIQKHYGLSFSEFIDKIRDLDIPKDKVEVRITNYRGSPLACSAIILVTEKGVIGEIINGDLYALTYMNNFDEHNKIHQFYISPENELFINSDDISMLNKVKSITKHIFGGNKTTELIDSGFNIYNGYIGGYYEYVQGFNGDSAFTDMNTKKISNNLDLENSIANIIDNARGIKSSSSIKGIVAHRNEIEITGEAFVIKNLEQDLIDIPDGKIIVIPMTTIDHLSLMKNSIAIITDFGGIMSHPAIISRELKIPTIVGTQNATEKIKHGNKIKLNMLSGEINLLD